jgi:hypothetical protein
MIFFRIRGGKIRNPDLPAFKYTPIYQCGLAVRVNPSIKKRGLRDRQDMYDTTGNIMVDYTLFGYENETT